MDGLDDGQMLYLSNQGQYSISLSSRKILPTKFSNIILQNLHVSLFYASKIISLTIYAKHNELSIIKQKTALNISECDFDIRIHHKWH